MTKPRAASFEWRYRTHEASACERTSARALWLCCRWCCVLCSIPVTIHPSIHHQMMAETRRCQREWAQLLEMLQHQQHVQKLLWFQALVVFRRPHRRNRSCDKESRAAVPTRQAPSAHQAARPPPRSFVGARVCPRPSGCSQVRHLGSRCTGASAGGVKRSRRRSLWFLPSSCAHNRKQRGGA